MKERIYTIPVSEAFREDCECPMCILEKRLEDDALKYTLGPSMMEPDSRIETNKKDFLISILQVVQQGKIACH